MGMFDSVYVPCPKCGSEVEFQSKAGDRVLARYSMETAPPEILYDILNEPHWCRECGTWFALTDPRYPPGHTLPPPQPLPSLSVLKEPDPSRYWIHSERDRFWRVWHTRDEEPPEAFSYEDLEEPPI